MTTPPLDVDALWSKARPDTGGLVPCVVQDVRSRRVLMVAWVSKEALAHSIETGWATFWSRSRRTIWEKGGTSGNRQRLLHVRLDCDGDTLIYTVEAHGPACHEGYDTCFSWRRVGNGWHREPERLDYPADRAAAVRPSDLVALVEAGAAEQTRKSASRPMRVGAEIERKARVVATHLQLKQHGQLPGAAAQLVAALVQSLTSAGVSLEELRAAFDPQGPTAAVRPQGADES